MLMGAQLVDGRLLDLLLTLVILMGTQIIDGRLLDPLYLGNVGGGPIQRKMEGCQSLFTSVMFMGPISKEIELK